MASKPPTHKTTLIRLRDVEPTAAGIRDLFDEEALAAIDGHIEPFTADRVTGLAMYGSFRTSAEGRHLLAVTTGAAIPEHENRRSAELVLIAVDGAVYAYGYGEGWRLIPDEKKDRRFGLQFGIRCLDPEQIKEIARRRPGEGGRSDQTCIAGAAPFWQFGISQQVEIINRLAGRSISIPTTHGRLATRPVTVSCSTGITIRLGIRLEDLIADIRAIAQVCATAAPLPELAFVDDVQPIDDPDVNGILDLELDDLLGRLGELPQQLAPSIPESCMERSLAANCFRYQIGSPAGALIADSLELAHIVRRTRVQRRGERVDALRKGRIEMYADAARTEDIGHAPAIAWLEADICYDGKHYFLLDGNWYELGDRYLAAVRRQIIELLSKPSAVTLPPWQLGTEEKDYNKDAADVTGFICMDRDGVQTRLHRRNGVEVCDLVGDHIELVHVKKASSSAPLSQLFQQAVVSTMALRYTPEAVTLFAQKVREKSAGRVTIHPDWRPAKVVFAILLKKGEPLTVETLFPFAQISLLHTVEVLNRHGITVDVIGIDAAVIPGLRSAA